MVAQIDSHYRELSRGRLLSRLASWALFEGRPHTTRGQWMNPAVLGMLKLLAKLPGNPVVERPVFIVGLGRSGTTLTGKILSVHPDVGFLNEGKAIWALAKPETDVCADYVTDAPRFCMTGVDADSDTARAVHRMYGRYATLTRNTRVVEKYPEMVFRHEFTQTIFPDALFVVVTRAGDASIQSIARWSEQNSAIEGESWWGRNNIKWETLRQEFLTRDRYARLNQIHDAALSEVDRAAIEWIVTTDASIELINAANPNVKWLHYDDLVDDPTSVVLELLASLELDPSGNKAVADYTSKVIHASTSYGDVTLHPVVEDYFESSKQLLEDAHKKRSMSSAH